MAVSEGCRAYVNINENGKIETAAFEENGSFIEAFASSEVFENLLKKIFNFMCKNDPEALKSILSMIYGKDLLLYEFGISLLEQRKKEEKQEK